MEKYTLDKEWKFHLGDIPVPFINTHAETYMAAKAGGAIGAASTMYDKSGWETVDLPHDYAVANEIDEKYGPATGYKKRGKAWYSRRFRLDEADRDKQILIEFEGITGEATIYLNGSVIGRNYSGYNSFTVDATDMALYGNDINELTVFVNADLIEGWWYEGAGIYRHVNLYKKHRLHFEHNGIFLEPVRLDASTWSVFAHIVVENTDTVDAEFDISLRLYDEEDNVIGSAEGSFSAHPYSKTACEMSFMTYSPKLWDIDSPTLYRAKAEIKLFGAAVDSEDINIGFRTIHIDKDGFYLNGRKVTLLGTCCHQDHAGVGVAVPDAVNEYRIKLLKELGSNAYRAAHGNASKAILDACDKYGILVMDENRQFNTAATDGLKQLKDMVMRDRNHPSVIMYSLYNEEPLQGTYTGRKLAERLRMTAEKYDGTRFTVGANNSGLLDKDGAYDVCDITGINYQTHLYDEFREQYPNLPVTGSENCSAFMTRGCYQTDMDRNVIDMFDSEAAEWGNTYRNGWRMIRERPYIMGYFIWTGFDYRGEPTPFAYPSISTQFGIMDTCGFPKSAYYLNKSYWTDEPVVHIVSHWNYTAGDTVKLRVFSNRTKLSLYINGKYCSSEVCDNYNLAVFDAVFEPGMVTVRAYDGSAEDTVYTSYETAALRLNCGMDTAYEDDAVCVNVSALDKNGHFVFDAKELIRFSVKGGKVLGVGNGDPNSHEADKADSRRLFAGLCQAVIAPYNGAEEMTVTAATDSGITESITIPVRVRDNAPKKIPYAYERQITVLRRTLELSDKYPDALAKISDSDMNTWVIKWIDDHYDSIFAANAGYAMYRTSVHIRRGEQLIFEELSGNTKDIYINGILVSSGASDFTYTAEDTDGIDITVVIGCNDGCGGILKPIRIEVTK
ncbi:MAG: beta-galactosidase [Clostridia bacterium]|nr:beta-galactosidase [Clostridia bacterium]